jgi:hypothetical protein
MATVIVPRANVPFFLPLVTILSCAHIAKLVQLLVEHTCASVLMNIHAHNCLQTATACCQWSELAGVCTSHSVREAAIWW